MKTYSLLYAKNSLSLNCVSFIGGMNARPSTPVQTSPECWERGRLTWEVCGQAQTGFTKGRCWISGAADPHIPSKETQRVNFKTRSTAHKLPHPPSSTVRPRLNDSEVVGWEHIHVHSCRHADLKRQRTEEEENNVFSPCLFYLYWDVQINSSQGFFHDLQ